LLTNVCGARFRTSPGDMVIEFVSFL
jgi:hypothetical protein